MITDVPLHSGSDAFAREMRALEEDEALAIQAQLALARRSVDRYAHRSVNDVLKEFAAMGYGGFVVEVKDGAISVTGLDTGDSGVQRMLSAVAEREVA